MAAIRFRQRRTRRWWYLGMTLAAVAFLATVFVAGSSANLAGSTFEGNDGNLVVNTAGDHDWDNAPNLSVGQDIATGQGDNSFGQGTKEDDSNVTVVAGSIPNSKADLARFAVAGEVIGTDTYMYLAWSRENKSGTVNFDFELNKLAQPDLTTPGAKTLNRSVNDLLINYAFQGGSNSPTLTKYHWTGSAWSNDGVISSACSEGATNSATVSENLGGKPAVDRPAQQFGEASINLTCAGIVPAGACESFGSGYVKSRSSTAFTSEIKDFIAPIPVSFSNCGKVIIRKVTVPSPDPLDSTFSYSTTGGLDPATFTLKNGGAQDYGSAVKAGSYSATEADPAPNYVLSSLDCSASSLTHGSTVSTDLGTRTASFTLKALDTIDCTFTNTLQQGAIKVKKFSIKGQALAGAVFSIAGQNVTTGDDGTACVDHLNFGSYDVSEVSAPPGYSRDDTSTHSVAVNAVNTCATIGVPLSLQFNDTPLTDIAASAQSQAPGGTQSTVSCVNQNGGADVGNSPQGPAESPAVAATGLAPGTYVCTIVVDP
jgi:hypothetical protein